MPLRKVKRHTDHRKRRPGLHNTSLNGASTISQYDAETRDRMWYFILMKYFMEQNNGDAVKGNMEGNGNDKPADKSVKKQNIYKFDTGDVINNISVSTETSSQSSSDLSSSPEISLKNTILFNNDKKSANSKAIATPAKAATLKNDNKPKEMSIIKRNKPVKNKSSTSASSSLSSSSFGPSTIGNNKETLIKQLTAAFTEPTFIVNRNDTDGNEDAVGDEETSDEEDVGNKREPSWNTVLQMMQKYGFMTSMFGALNQSKRGLI